MEVASLPPLMMPNKRLQICVIIAATLHLIIIFGITYKDPLNLQKNLLTPAIEITLATQPSDTMPEAPKFIAAENQQASSPIDTDLAPQTLQHADFPAQHMHDLWQPPQLQAETAAQQESPNKVTATDAPEQTQIQPLPETQANANMLSTEQQALSQNIATLMAELADQQQQYAQMPRTRTVTAATQEAIDAEYLYNWRNHIEKVGNLNYPAAARRLNLHGEVLLLVAINADGTLRETQVRKSSGSKILDEAAIRIVKLAAPFQPLPSEILATTEVLEIIRTWQFRTDQSWGAGD